MEGYYLPGLHVKRHWHPPTSHRPSVPLLDRIPDTNFMTLAFYSCSRLQETQEGKQTGATMELSLQQAEETLKAGQSPWGQ